MNKRINHSSGAPWEDTVGYSRAVQIGNLLEISGTVATNEQGIAQHPTDVYLQTQFILEKIKSVLEKAGFTLEDVVRTRLYVTDIRKWEKIGKAHGEYFTSIKPATSMVEVSKLIDDAYLIEIEVTALKAS